MASSSMAARLERPQFFSGQLLTDEDLQALVDWAQTRFCNAALRDGSGVFHGLELSVDPDTPLTLWVESGIAVNTHGQEIVLSERQSVSLERTAVEKARGSGSIQSEFAGLEIGEHVLTRFRVEIQFAPKNTRLSPRLATEDDQNDSAHSRVNEGSVITFSADPAANEPANTVGFSGAKELLQNYENSIRVNASASAIKEWFVRETNSDRLRDLGLSYNHEKAPVADFANEANVAKLLFFSILAERMHRTVVATAAPIEASTGQRNESNALVPVCLGHIWIAEPAGQSDGSIRILGIQPAARGGGKLPGPVPSGQVEMRDVLWSDGDHAVRIFAERGLSVAEVQQLDRPGGLAWFHEEAWIQQSRCVSIDDEILVQTMDLGALGRRIVGYYGRTRERLTECFEPSLKRVTGLFDWLVGYTRVSLCIHDLGQTNRVVSHWSLLGDGDEVIPQPKEPPIEATTSDPVERLAVLNRNRSIRVRCIGSTDEDREFRQELILRGAPTFYLGPVALLALFTLFGWWLASFRQEFDGLAWTLMLAPTFVGLTAFLRIFTRPEAWK